MDVKDCIQHVQILRWLRCELDEATEQAVEAHLEGCDACARIVDDFKDELDPFVAILQVASSGSSTFETTDSDSLDRSTDVDESLPRSVPPEQQFEGQTMDRSGTQITSSSRSRWQPELLIGSGGIGEVWVAQDTLLGRTVALKKLKRSTAGVASVQARFLAEARITARLEHPGTVTVMDLVDDGPDSYYVMTLVRGRPLSELIRRDRQAQADDRCLTSNTTQLIRYWIAVARTIAFAHSRRILHRDLKSDNIIVGEFGQVTVIDWGLAKRIGETDQGVRTPVMSAGIDGSPLSTLPGAKLGTPCFMAPEQARGESHRVDEQTDVWGLGAMLYEILTGRPPFEGATPEHVIQAVIDKPVDSPRDLFPRLPTGLCDLCMGALQKDKLMRLGSVTELAGSVENWMNKDAAQKQSSQARQKLFELSGELMFIFDFQSRIVWGNAAWKRQLGWEPEQWIGKPSESLVHPEDTMPEEKKQQIRRGETVVHEVRNRHVNGSYRWYSWHFTAVPDEGHIYAIGIRIDREA
ncbi:MAG: protein kinase [Planctomycetota bacterium]